MALTGNRASDIVLLINISDEKDFLSLCQTNKRASEYCNNDELLLSRLGKYYPNLIKWKPKTTEWKKYYLKCMYYIGKLKEIGFEYTAKSTGPPSEYYYFSSKISNYSNEITKIIKMGYLDLFLFLAKKYTFSDYNKTKILKYSPVEFVSKYLDEIFHPKELSNQSVLQLMFQFAAKGGRWDNHQFLLSRFSDNNLFGMFPGLYLSFVGNGGNKDIINYAIKKYSYIGNDAVNLIIAMGAYEKLHIEIGDKYFGMIEDLYNMEIIEVADAYTDQFLLIAVKSGNKDLLDKIIEELYGVLGDDGDVFYNTDFILSFSQCSEKNSIWCEKLIKLGFPEKIKPELLQIIESHDFTIKTAEKLKFLINTAL